MRHGRAFAVLMTSAALAAAPSAVATGAEPPGCDGESSGLSDFDGDQIADAIVADPGVSVDGKRAAGVIHVVYGPAEGAGDAPAGVTTVDLSSPGVPGVRGRPSVGDRFGSTIEVTFLDEDKCADVLVAAPGKRVSGQKRAGVVYVVYGAPGGLGQGRPGAVIRPGKDGLPGGPEQGAHFGSALALPTGYSVSSALVLGAPGETVRGRSDAGAIYVLYRDSSGLPTAGLSRRLTQRSDGVPGAAEADDEFGSVIALGDLSDGGGPAVFVGVPKEDTAAGANSGVVYVLYDAGPGETIYGARWSQDTEGVEDEAEAGDQFGASLSYRTSEYQAFADGKLAIGVPREDVDGVEDAGTVQLFKVRPGNELDTGEQYLLTQGGDDLSDEPEPGDRFGEQVLIVPWDTTHSQLILALGTPREDIGDVVDAGMVQRVGVEFGISDFEQVFHQGLDDVPGEAGTGDRLGSSLAAVPWISSGDWSGMLLIGVPRDAEHEGGIVIAAPYVLTGGDPENPVYDPMAWIPGLDGFPAESVSFGAAVGGQGSRYPS